jgi:signal transduction histidine kinase/CheY-like chemotaxis protein
MTSQPWRWFSLGRLPIRRKLLLLVIVSSLVPLSIAIWTMFSRARDLARQSAVVLLETRGDQLSSELDAFHSVYLGSASRLGATLGTQSAAVLAESTIPAKDEKSIRALIDIFHQSFDGVRGVSIIGSDGYVRLTTDPVTRGMDVSTRPYFQEALKGRPFISDLFLSTGLPEPVALIAYAAPIETPGREVVGVLVMYVKGRALWDVVRTANGRAGPGSFSVLYDHAGIRIAHSFNEEELFRPGGSLPADVVNSMVREQRFGDRTRELLENPSPMPEEYARVLRPAASQSNVFSGYSPSNGQMNLAVVRQLKMVPWTLFCLAPQASLDAPIASLASSTALGGGLFVLLVLGMAVLFARRIIQPITELAGAAGILRTGDLRARVKVHAEDELGILAHSFNQMADALSASQGSLEMRVRDRTLALERANEELTAQKEELVAQKDELALQQDDLRRKGLELERANQMKSEFLANMSHELRTPLNAIIGFSEILVDDTASEFGPLQREHLSLILDSGRHLLGLINDILDLSKIEAGAAELSCIPVGPAEAIAEATDLVEPAVRSKRIELKQAVLSSRPVYADPAKLRQILLNLLSNAVKFAPEQSTVLVTAENSGDMVKFRVSDQGPGIEPALLSRLFEPFVQGENPFVKEHQGTGLGLAITKRLVEQHGGSILIEGTPGGGASFIFTIPAASSESGPRSISPNGPLVMVVDADPHRSSGLRTRLESGGYRVVELNNGQDAAAVAAELRPSAILLDPGSGQRDGQGVGIGMLDELARREETRDVPVVMSRLPRPASLLPKPIEARAILRMVDRLVGQTASPGGAARPGGLQGPTVLVVDDDPRVHQLLATVLGPPGYRLRSAAGGLEALEAALKEPPDILIIDLLMPGMSGFDLIKALTSHDETRRVPIIVLTAAEVSPEDRARLRGDIHALARKGDVTEDELLAAVNAATAGRVNVPLPASAPAILIVDDNDMNRELARTILVRRGYRVLAAENGEVGVETALRELPSLILMDLAMPKKDGYTAARELKADKRTAGIPIVALTAMAMSGDEQKAYAAGIDGYVTKPIDRRALEEAVRRFLA